MSNNNNLKMPEPKPVLRDGDALLEFHHEGEVVGEFNFSKIVRSWWKTATGAAEATSLEVVK